jgi:hypothetical protein
MIVNSTITALVVASLFALTQPAQAQSAYRCEDNGAVTYQATPCAGGRAVSGDARAQEQRQQALDARERDDKLAAKMEKDRAARARATPTPAGATAIKPEQAAAPKVAAESKPRKKRATRKKATDPKVFGEKARTQKPSKPAALKAAK